MASKRWLWGAAAVLLAASTALAGCASPPVGSGKGGNGQSGGPAKNDPARFAAIIPQGDIVAASKKLVHSSLTATEGFTPPTSGPKGQQRGATIAYVGSDLTNCGINAVAKGVKEAAAVLGWTVNDYDGKATAQGRSDAMQQAIAAHPAAIVVGGFDPTEQAAVIKQAGDAKIPVIGWHAGAKPGAGNGMFSN